ncbi:MAG TPA: hypothetical protein DCP26_10285 [Brevundimonas sp.]|nr:hypothetical protein [Brevundimonas sp.]
MLGVVFLALAMGLSAQTPPPIPMECPDLSETERQEIQTLAGAGGLDTDAAHYAAAYCVAHAEARRRLEIQNRDAIGPQEEPGPPPPPPPDSVAALMQRLQAEEAETFAGMWWQHQPDYRMIVAFTRDAEATLRQYTADPLFEARLRPGPTEAEMLAEQARLYDALSAHGAVSVMSGPDIMTGRIEAHVSGDIERIEAARASGALQIADFVDLIGPPPLRFATPPPPPADIANPVRAFPRARHRYIGVEPAILRTGRIVLEDGCLRLEGERRNLVILWPEQAALDLSTEPGAVRVFDRMSGAAIRAGETAVLGGASGPAGETEPAIDEDPACPGPYYRVTSASSYAEFEAARLEQDAERIARERNVSLAEARREVAARRSRDAQLRALAERLEQDHPDAFGEAWVIDGRAQVYLVPGRIAEPDALVPPDLRPFVVFDEARAAKAPLQAQVDRLVEAMEAAGLDAMATANPIQGRVTVNAPDIPALSAAVTRGDVVLPDHVALVGSGALPFGGYVEGAMEAEDRLNEAAPDLARMRTLIEATPIRAIHAGGEADGPDMRPSRASSLQIARDLVGLGFTADEVARLKAAGADPVRAWVDENGFATPASRAILSDAVVVAEVIAVDPRDPDQDGFRSTVRFRVVEPLKGELAPDEPFAVRFVSGFDPDGAFHHGAGDPAVLPGLQGFDPGSRWLLTLTQGFYARQARFAGGSPRPSVYATFREPAKVVGDNVEPTYFGEPERSLDALRREIAPVQAAVHGHGGR